NETPIPTPSLRSAGLPSTAARTAELFVQRARMRGGAVGNALSAMKRTVGRTATALDIQRANVGDIGFELTEVDLAMSPVSHWLLDRLDLTAIRNQRIANLRTLSAGLEGQAPCPLPT